VPRQEDRDGGRPQLLGGGTVDRGSRGSRTRRCCWTYVRPCWKWACRCLGSWSGWQQTFPAAHPWRWWPVPRGFWERSWARTPPELARLGASLAFAHLTGAPTAGLLRSAAELERRSSLRAAERRAAEMGVRLVVPLGVCVLPAFICLGIVPVVMSLLPALG
jgi:hypothetical protein